MAVVELRGLSKTFPNGVEAVSAVDLSVGEGEFFAVVGPSGSGKSTLLRLIAGLESPTAGSVWIGGRDVTAMSPRDRDVAMVFQDPALYPYLSVLDNLAFGLRARGVGRDEATRRVRSVAASLGLSGLLGRRPRTLSGGQRRRVALGRAIVRQPSVYLLDEPLSGLDGPLRAAVRDDLIGLHRATRAPMIHVTHDQAECLAMGDRVAVMDGGRVLQVGTPRAVYERPATRFVATFLGSPPASLIPGWVSEDGTSVHFGPPGLLDGPTVAIPQGRWAGPLAARAGRCVELVLRPEHVAIGRPGDDIGPSFVRLPVEAEVSRLEYLGHDTAAYLSLFAAGVAFFFSHGLVARVPSASPIRPGERLAVGVDLERASWFDAETGLALAPSPDTLA